MFDNLLVYIFILFYEIVFGKKKLKMKVIFIFVFLNRDIYFVGIVKLINKLK